jgi:deoxyribodipyrimidine photolyase
LSDYYNNISMSLDTLTIEQVAEKIKVKNTATAKKWLNSNGIKIHKLSNSSVVYQVEVDSHLDKPFVQNLRNKYPNKWKERYREVVKDISVYNLTITLLEDEIPYIPTVKPSKINKKDEEKYKKLLG